MAFEQYRQLNSLTRNEEMKAAIRKSANGSSSRVKFKKAPGAPRRFKSAYMFFSTDKHREIREGLTKEGKKEKTTVIAKMVSEAWKELPQDEREKFEELARKDKARFEVEKTMYNGPWKVPAKKRSQKDPSAPKRPMSAFLSFSHAKRSEVKDKNPNMNNAEISRVLATMWKEAPEEDKKSHIDKEFKLRQEYKAAIAVWREKHQKELDDQRKQREDAALQRVDARALAGLPIDPSDDPAVIAVAAIGASGGPMGAPLSMPPDGSTPGVPPPMPHGAGQPSAQQQSLPPPSAAAAYGGYAPPPYYPPPYDYSAAYGGGYPGYAPPPTAPGAPAPGGNPYSAPPPPGTDPAAAYGRYPAGNTAPGAPPPPQTNPYGPPGAGAYGYQQGYGASPPTGAATGGYPPAGYGAPPAPSGYPGYDPNQPYGGGYGYYGAPPPSQAPPPQQPPLPKGPAAADAQA